MLAWAHRSGKICRGMQADPRRQGCQHIQVSHPMITRCDDHSLCWPAPLCGAVEMRAVTSLASGMCCTLLATLHPLSLLATSLLNLLRLVAAER
jgi:hypothetical protein